MPSHLTCTLCSAGSSLATAADVAAIPCNVRRFRNHTFTLWRCRGCQSLHCAEDADLRKFYEGYPLGQQRMDRHLAAGFANRLRLLRRQGLQRHFRILDYGCGSGLFVQYLRQQGYDNAVGYDKFSFAFAHSALLDQTYDMVVSYDVIEHDDDPRAFLQQQAALVRPGGKLVIGTPNAANLSLARKTDLNLHVPYHRDILSEQALQGLAGEIGLRTRQVHRRSYFDTLKPAVNWRFMSAYNEAAGGVLDAVNEPPRPELVTGSPRLIFLALFGYFLPLRDGMIVTFEKAAAAAVSARGAAVRAGHA